MISNETRDLFFILHGHVIHLIASVSGLLCYLFLARTLKVKACIDRKSFAQVRTLERMGGSGKGLRLVQESDLGPTAHPTGAAVIRMGSAKPGEGCSA